jgi:Fe-S-cluster-containing hydrogenase component 2
MKEGVAYTGVPSSEELKNAPGVPSAERMKRGPVAVIECVQEIPCNPCEKACPFGAITVGDNITQLPILDEEKCTGCGVCVAQCPGLAIFTVDMSSRENEAVIGFPYEYLPVPKVGDEVDAISRKGSVVCRGIVESVKNPKTYKNTNVIQVRIPAEYVNEVRGIKKP